MADNTERTMQPTARRRRDARSAGHSPRSAALVNGSQLLLCVAMFSLLGEGLVVAFAEFTEQSFVAATPHGISLSQVSKRVANWGQTHLSGWLLSLIALAVVINVAQLGGLRFLPHRVLPNLARIHPGSGLAKSFGRDNWIAGAQTLAIVVVLFVCLFGYWWMQLPRIVALTQFSDGQILMAMVRIATSAGFLMATILLAFGLIDYGVNWWRFEQSLRMSPEEVRQEMKDAQGSVQRPRQLESSRRIR